MLLPDDAPDEERFNALGDTRSTPRRAAVRRRPRRCRSQPRDRAADRRSVRSPSRSASLELKGKSAPLESLPRRRRAGAGGTTLSPLVGRDDEVAALDDVMADLADGRGAIVAITGEPGIGKSRLIAEVRLRAEDSVRFFGTQGISYAEDVPYYPLRETACARASASAWRIRRRAFGSS